MTITAAPRIRRSSWDDAPSRYKLFTLVDDETGGEVDYSMPRAKHPGILLGYLQVARQQGGEIAASWLIERAVGAEGYAALANEPELDEGTINSIVRTILAVVRGTAPAQAGDETEADSPQPGDEPRAGEDAPF